MSSKLQLDVCLLNQWWRHLVNAYELKAGMVFVADKTVWSMPERFKVVCIPCKVLYKCSALPFIPEWIMGTSPTGVFGNFAYWTVHLLYGHFAYKAVRQI